MFIKRILNRKILNNKKLIIKLSIVLCLFLILIISASLWFISWKKTPLSSSTEEIHYTVTDGSSFKRITYDLYRRGLLTHPEIFRFYAKIKGVTRHIESGIYIFHKNDTPSMLLQKLVSGNIIITKITLPEGYNIYQVAGELAARFPNTSAQEWLDIMHSPELIKFIDPNLKINSLEGFIYPQTYYVNPTLAPKKIIKQFLLEFKKNAPQALFTKTKSKDKMDLLSYVTLASIVEKETSLPKERGKIAAVYLNRLKIGMKLQADPTVIYGIWKHYRGKLTKKDLLANNPYNTYKYYGLPPGPIANPGVNSLIAVLNPPDFGPNMPLYFVAQGDGSHVFSENLVEHNKAVQKYIHTLRTEKTKKGKNKKIK